MADNENIPGRVPSPGPVDLTNMATVDAKLLLRVLDDAEVVFGNWANGDQKILKGEQLLRSSGKARELRVVNLQLANNSQKEMIVDALQSIAAGKTSAQMADNLWHMLASVAGVSDGPLHR